jgi:DNA-binding YbaB/EbfC family protein
MFGGLSNIAGLMKQAKVMQGRMKEIQETIANSRYEAESGGGAVRATVSGKLDLVGLKIDPATVKGGDVEMLEDFIKSAVCAAQRKASEGAKAELQKMTGGLNLPGLEGLLEQAP